VLELLRDLISHKGAARADTDEDNDPEQPPAAVNPRRSDAENGPPNQHSFLMRCQAATTYSV
jgi:hypothetical protein